MAGNTTLTIIKPDAFGAGKAGKIIALLEEKGFTLKPPASCTSRWRRRGSSTRAPRAAILRRARAVHDVGAVHADGAGEGGRRRGTARRHRGDRSGRSGCRHGPEALRRVEGAERDHASDSDENAQREARFFFAESELLWG
jgi:nucleoside-diphosphate kinase